MGRKAIEEARREFRHFNYAVHELGLAGERKAFVCDEAAEAIGVPRPTTKEERRAVLQAFYAYDPAHRREQVRTRVWLDVNSDEFLKSYEWRRLRMEVLTERGARCECCGASPRDGIVIHVDHIKPRRKYPELALTKANLQVLCEVCNHGKGAWDETDWRAASQPSGERSWTPIPRSGLSHGHEPATLPRPISRTQEGAGRSDPKEDSERKEDALGVFMVTSDWINAHATPNGGWTRDQLVAIGVSWPPPKGWKPKVAGTRISESSRRAFETGGAS